MKTNKATVAAVVATAGWIVLALIKNTFAALVDVILEYQNRRNWKNQTGV